MGSLRTWMTCCCILAAGCGGNSSSGTNNINPYANNTVEQGSHAPPTGYQRPRSSGQAAQPGRSDAGAQESINLPKAGYAAEIGVPLSLVEYFRFARRSSEMLNEMAQIHAEVSESGDAGEHQGRWGQLTAEHTKLVRDVVSEAYPPPDLARELRRSALPTLDAALKTAAAVMKEFNDVEGGLAQPHAEARMIFEHLSKNLTPEELANMSSEAVSGSDETSDP